MTFSAIKHVTYSAAGGFTAGSIIGAMLFRQFPARIAAAAHPYFRLTGAAVAITALVSRAVDEVFKGMGWTEATGMRLIVAHVIVGAAIMKPVIILVGEPIRLGKVVACALTITALAVNIIIK